MTTHMDDEILHRYLDGELSWEERQRVRGHVATCPACRDRLEALRRAEYALRNLAAFDLPADFTDRVMSRVRRRAPTLLWTRAAVSRFARGIIFIGLLLLVVAVGEAWLFQEDLPSLGESVLWVFTWLGMVWSDPEAALDVLTTEGGEVATTVGILASTVVPLALALLALGLFIYMVRRLAATDQDALAMPTFSPAPDA